MKQLNIMTKEFWKINGIFIGILFMMIGIFWTGSKQFEVLTTTKTDKEIIFTVEDGIIEQAWTPNVKNINKIVIPMKAINTFEGILQVDILSDNLNVLLGSKRIKHIFTENLQEEVEVDFDESIQVEIGRRHYIRISFQEGSEYGEVSIPINSKYTGGSINGEIEGAIQLAIGSEKNSRILWVAITYMPFFGVAICFSLFFGKKLEETLGVSFGIIVLWIILFGLINKMELGGRLLFPLSVLLYGLIIYRCNKKRIMIQSLVTPGIVLYVGGIAYVMVSCQDYFRKGWDEYIQWGIAVKDMFIFNAFANHTGSGLFVKRYPPFTTVLEYFFMYTNGVFSESILFVAYISMLFALLLIGFRKITWKRKRYIVPALIILLLVPMVFYQYLYTLYVDLFLMVLVTYVLVCYFEEKFTWFNIIRIASGMVALVLTKDMGLVLAGLILVMILADVFGEYIRKERVLNADIIAKLIVVAMSVAVPFIVWQIYLSTPIEITSGITKTIEAQPSNAIQASRIGIKGIWEVLTLQAPQYKYQVIKKFMRGILYELKYTLGNISFSYIGLWIIHLIVALFFKNDDEGKRIYKCGLLSGLIVIGYAMALLVTYLFAFAPKEALVITSADRYLASCIGGIVLAIWVLIFEKWICCMQNVREKTLILVLCSVIFFCVPLSQLNPSNIVTYVTEENVDGYEGTVEGFRTFCDKEDSVYYVSHYLQPLDYLIFVNNVYPIQNPVLYKTVIYASEDSWKEEARNPIENKGGLDKGIIVSKDEWEKILLDYDYVYLCKPANVFVKSYGDLFEEPSSIADGSCYKVSINEEKVLLEYIGNMK